MPMMDSTRLRVAGLVAAAVAAAAALVVLRQRSRRRRRVAVVDGWDVYCVDGCDFDEALAAKFAGAAFLGLDCEWVPGDSRLAIVQIAARGACAVVRVRRSPASPALRALLARAVVCGVGVDDDARRLERDLGVAVGRTADLRFAAREVAGLAKGERDGLAALACRFAAERASLPHKANDAVRLGDWAAEQLSAAQIEYAAGDAIASALVLEGVHRKSANDGAALDRAWLETLPAAPPAKAAAAPRKKQSSSTATETADERARRKAKRRERYEKWHEEHSTSRLYDNIELLGMDGKTVLGLVNEGKAKWYVDKKMATFDGEKRVVLNYAPDFAEDEKKCLVVKKRNACVGCGATKPLTRFYIVPYRFRRCFPVQHKSNNSHDVVPLCLRCRGVVEPHYRAMERSLEAAEAPPRTPETQAEAQLRAARRAARTLLRDAKKGQIPAARRAELAKTVQGAIGDVDDAALRRFAEVQDEEKRVRDKVYVDGDALEARAVRALLEGAKTPADVAARLHGFAVRWRNLFVEVLDPKCLPAGWTVAHDQRPRARPPPAETPCRAFLNGRCAWGASCKYRHGEPPPR